MEMLYNSDYSLLSSGIILYRAHSAFLDDVLDGHIIATAFKFWGISSFDESPTKTSHRRLCDVYFIPMNREDGYMKPQQ